MNPSTPNEIKVVKDIFEVHDTSPPDVPELAVVSLYCIDTSSSYLSKPLLQVLLTANYVDLSETGNTPTGTKIVRYTIEEDSSAYKEGKRILDERTR